MEGTNNNIKFNSAVYFSTPVWNADASIFLKKMLKLTDGYLKHTQKKFMNKSIKERNKLYKHKIDDFGNISLQVLICLGLSGS